MQLTYFGILYIIAGFCGINSVLLLLTVIHLAHANGHKQ